MAAAIDNHAWTLRSTLGHPVVLFFFCGCNECHHVASSWADLTRSGVLRSAPFTAARSATPVIAVVYSGDVTDLEAFSAQTGLTGVVLIPDPEMKLTNLYRVGPCPRVFVLDQKGVLRYTNSGTDDAPQGGHEDLIVARALTALRACVQPAAHGQAKAGR